jgi:hypothetical protein
MKTANKKRTVEDYYDDEGDDKASLKIACFYMTLFLVCLLVIFYSVFWVTPHTTEIEKIHEEDF